ncbi:unnamed protein product [Camellia sinensis]
MEQTQGGEEAERRRRVVVVGGGIAGSLVAKSLQFHGDVTLIDPGLSSVQIKLERAVGFLWANYGICIHNLPLVAKEYLEIPWASLRSMVEPSFTERSLIYHRDYLTNGRIITSSAISVTNTEVLTSEGRLVGYDYLVIATGHADPLPASKSDRFKQYQAEHEKIERASSILIVGGGPTGVELAGEIAVDYPDKKLTLVHSGTRLLQFIGPKASNKTLDWLKSKKVEVKLEQSVDLKSVSETSKTFLTSSGETVNADCHFLCTAKPMGSTWLKESVLKDSLDHFGRIMVDENLRVKGHPNVFAIGDITDIKEIKQGYLAQKHALVAAKNLKLLMIGGKEKQMASYHQAHSASALVSLGRKEAVAQLPFTTLIGHIPGLIKSRDLFVGKTRKQMGLNS